MTEPIFCGTELAARIESAEAQMIAAGTDAALRRHLDLAFITPVATGRRRNGTGVSQAGRADRAAVDRLANAAAAGCDIAVVTTAPGSKSQQNVQRQGFQLLYTRAVLVK